MNPHLLAQSGPMAGQRIELVEGINMLGREAGNTVVIADQTVSRQHARISVANGVATLEDAGSSGGTYINEMRIVAPTLLRVGDTIRLGGTAFAFVPGASVSPMGVTATMPSRGGRKREVGTAEAAQNAFPGTSMPLGGSDNPGCMPDFSNIFKDIEGCMPWLIRALIVFIIIVVLVAIIGGIFVCGAAGIGAIHGAASQHAGNAGDGSSQPPADQQQQQQQQQQQKAGAQSANGTIKILSIKTAYLPREGYHAAVPVILITWQNTGPNPVVEVSADITAYDKTGAVIGFQKSVRIYKGPAVSPNSVHADNEQSEGEIVALDQGKEQALDHAVAKPTEISTEAAPTPDDE